MHVIIILEFQSKSEKKSPFLHEFVKLIIRITLGSYQLDFLSLNAMMTFHKEFGQENYHARGPSLRDKLEKRRKKKEDEGTTPTPGVDSHARLMMGWGPQLLHIEIILSLKFLKLRNFIPLSPRFKFQIKEGDF